MAKTFVQIQDGDGNVREVEIDENDMESRRLEKKFKKLHCLYMEEEQEMQESFDERMRGW